MAEQESVTADAPSRRRPLRSTTDGYASGEKTRLKIIEAAIVVFGTHGYKATSTRMIAREAAVNLAALQYYFGGKEGLYRACAAHIAEHLLLPIITPSVEKIDQVLRDPNTSSEALLAILRSVMDVVIDHLVGRQEPPSWALFLMREREHPSEIAEALLQNYVHAIARLIGRLSLRPAEDPVTILSAFITLSQLQGVIRLRDFIMRAMQWPDFEGERLEMVKAALWRQIRASLTPSTN